MAIPHPLISGKFMLYAPVGVYMVVRVYMVYGLMRALIDTVNQLPLLHMLYAPIGCLHGSGCVHGLSLDSLI